MSRQYKPRTVVYQGKDVPLRELAAQHGVSYLALYGRVYTSGMPIEQALEKPVQQREKSKRRSYRA